MGRAEAGSLSVQKFGDGPGAFRNGLDGVCIQKTARRFDACKAASSQNLSRNTGEAPPAQAARRADSQPRSEPIAIRASTSLRICASVWNGVGVMRSRSCPRATVG